jgi:hypothetical protein
MSFNILPEHLFCVVKKSGHVYECRGPKIQRVARYIEYYGKFLKRYNSLLRSWDHNKDTDVFLNLGSSFCETSSTNLSLGHQFNDNSMKIRAGDCSNTDRRKKRVDYVLARNTSIRGPPNVAYYQTSSR